MHYQPTDQCEFNPPIFVNSSFVFKDCHTAQSLMVDGNAGNIYSRFTNPTVQLFENTFAKLEQANHCIATSSGMAAVNLICQAYLKQGDHMICANNVFGSTIGLLSNFFAKFGVTIDFIDCTNIDLIKQTITPNTKIVFIETPSNPLGRITNIQVLSQLTKQHNAYLVVDNTYCTPVLQKPLDLGADFTVYSATKYIDGSGRVVGGCICSNLDIANLRQLMRNAGASLSPFNAWALYSGLNLLELRMQKHCDNALTVANWLQTQPWVEQVHYAGLKQHPDHKLATEQQQGYSGIIAFEYKGDIAQTWQLIDNCKLLTITPNLGDIKSTIIHPATTTHGKLSPIQQQQAGIKNNLVRISIGLEAVQDIQKDLEQATL